MPKAAPLVSIVVCTYNGKDFLEPQLQSLADQTYKNIEILISDDGSTDGTVAIAESFASKDRRVRLNINIHNLGYNKNFEMAFALATGEYIAVCDQDDIWKEKKIETMLDLFSDENVLLAHCQSVRFIHETPPVEKYSSRKPFEGSDLKKLMFFNTIAGHNIIFRKRLLQFIGHFPEDVFYDWWLVICAALYGKIRATEAVLTFHRFHGTNITLGKKDEKKQSRAKAEERLQTVRQILELPVLTPEQRKFAGQLAEGLQTVKEKNFSLPLFLFLLRNAHIVFFFKKKSWFSKAKMAYRLSFATK